MPLAAHLMSLVRDRLLYFILRVHSSQILLIQIMRWKFLGI